MPASIPTSTSVVESAVVDAPLAAVWHLIKLNKFADWWSALKSSDVVKDVSDETDVVRWTFKDGTVVDIKQEAHSTIDHYITYSAITSAPEMSYSSVLSTVRCWPVTSGKSANGTFVQWTANFSGDADAGVIQDARYKRQDGLADLAKAAQK
ncbi:bet v1-like protein [Purpureocillium lavendulum]|uniref:Bet v1-like protein n=1 Tax=Purpureocillium lavendulum TaxID=1247861 RepID=A0AB34FX32_9HYPO|nr:bet v1-like protein [Purpureocillium lavendulum]